MKHADKLSVTVNTTSKCNLRCGYCMADSAREQRNPIKIDKEFAKKGIRDAMTGYPTRIKAKIIRFFSPGEPTQEMDIIKECISFARSINPEVIFELQTNGIFENIGDAEWIRDNFDIVWFSLDGPAKINDKNRPDELGCGRTIEAENNMRIVGEKASVGVRATIVEETMDYQDQLVKYYKNLGVQNLAFNPVICAVGRNKVGRSIVTKGDIMRFAKNFIKAYDIATKLGVNLTNSLIFNFDERTEVGCRSCLPMPQLNPDGSVSSCDMALYSDTQEELKCFIYGKWNIITRQIDYFPEKIEYLSSRRLGNLPICDVCDIKHYCAGGCAGRIAYQTGNIFDVIPEYCLATKYMARHIILGEGRMKWTHP